MSAGPRLRDVAKSIEKASSAILDAILDALSDCADFLETAEAEGRAGRAEAEGAPLPFGTLQIGYIGQDEDGKCSRVCVDLDDLRNPHWVKVWRVRIVAEERVR